jgi:antagonist of KipI
VSSPATVLVERPGMLTTVQDCGRHGWQHVGVVPSGAMDCDSLQLANALVGNDLHLAGLEVTLRGPILCFPRDTLVALAGAQFDACITVDGRELPCPLNRPVLLRAGDRLSINQPRHGFRAYLAVAGGIDVAPMLGSRCTYLAAAMGGIAGRALKKGDRLPLAPQASDLSHARFDRLTHGTGPVSPRFAVHSVPWSVAPRSLPRDEPTVVRCVDGHHRELFSPEALEAFEVGSYRISPQSNRMGYRMLGTRLERAQAGDILSEPTALGTVQVPADGLPIVLMADHQTTGGYAKIAEVASADIARLAQLRPGQEVRFARCTLAEARSLAQAAHQALQVAVQAIRLKFNAPIAGN